jgi:cephalosporin-C deacetylase-like acetyl esterase
MKIFVCALAACAALIPLIGAAQTAPDSRAALITYLDGIASTRLAERRAAVAQIKTPADVERRQAQVRAKVLDLIGGLPERGGPLAARTTSRIEADGYRTETVIFDSMPGQHVTATLFLPKAGKGPFPAIVISPGHSPTGRQGDYSFGANFARNGVAALTYDIVGEGERLQYYDPELGVSRVGRPTGEHSMAAFHTWLIGGHVARYFVFDAVRAIDYLTDRPEIDDARIGAFGCSGGGTVTAYLAALDERVKAAAVACYINDFETLLKGPGPQDAEQSIQDFIASGLDIPDWIELAAPKPYAVVSTTEDMFPFAGARAAVEDARPFWTAYGAGDRLEWITGPGGHGALAPISDRIVAFFLRAFGLPADKPSFSPRRPADPATNIASETGQVGGETIGSINQAAAARLPRRTARSVTLPAEVRALARIEAIPGATQPQATATEETRDGLVWTSVTFASPRGPLAARYVRPAGAATGKVALILDPAPLATLARPGGRLETLAKKGWAVLALQSRGSDGAEEIKSAVVGDQNLLALRAHLVGKTLIGLRVDDAIMAMDWLASQSNAPVTVVGVGASGPVALHAAALDARIEAVRMESSPFSWRLAALSPLQRDLPPIVVPGALQVYDLPDLMTAIAPRRITLVSPVGPVGEPLMTTRLADQLDRARAATINVAPSINDGW